MSARSEYAYQRDDLRAAQQADAARELSPEQVAEWQRRAEIAKEWLDQSEPAPEDVARWQMELDRDRAAADRTPIGVTVGVYGIPFVVCRDGTVWQMESQPAGPEVGDGRLYVWEQLPSVPGSTGDLSHSYWNEPNGRGR